MRSWGHDGGDGHSTGHSAVPRPRHTGAPQVLAALLSLLACPSAAMAVFILVAGQRVALPHLVFCLLQLVILVPLVRGGARALRPTRLSRPRDAAPPLLLLLAAHHGRRHPRCPVLGRDGGAARDSRPDLRSEARRVGKERGR